MKRLSGKVLIVDDSKSTTGAISRILERDYIIKTAPNGEKAIEINQEYDPDVILLDVALPGIDGYEVCRRIRSENNSRFKKIIMISVRTMLNHRLEGYASGADDYLVKPFEPEELLAKVRVFLRLRHTEKELYNLNRELDRQVNLRTRQLLEAEKMAVIGRYTAGIVHNLNNPLQAIMGNAELLSFRHPGDSSVMALRRASAQMKKIIGTILSAGYKNNSSEYSDVDLNEVLREQTELLRANPFYRRYPIRLITEFRPLPLIRGIYFHFSQSIGNLIKNAVEAMYNSDTRELRIESAFRDNAVIISISDTGPGIREEEIEKIFHPFFTTKPLSAEDKSPTGTGLGLASAKEMIEAYRGSIRVVSEPGKGSEFIVMLPVQDS
ncbi:MAG: response regulator [Desulfococcaceae bacterium]|jgi:signal transduction histidine kinase|nr:response regulator [Desulfococcaceae bacterium]